MQIHDLFRTAGAWFCQDCLDTPASQACLLVLSAYQHGLRTPNEFFLNILNILANWADRPNKLWGIFGSRYYYSHKFCPFSIIFHYWASFFLQKPNLFIHFNEISTVCCEFWLQWVIINKTDEIMADTGDFGAKSSSIIPILSNHIENQKITI